MSTRDFQDRLARRARKAGLVIPADVGARLEAYYRLLATWNSKINLAGFDLARLSPEALDRVLIEPLVAASHMSVAVRSIIDIGSGGGSPAIPLALAAPGTAVLMVESKSRKAIFLREALRALELNECDVMSSRYEELLVEPRLHESHDLVTIRAVRVEARTLLALQSFLKPGGQMFLFQTASGGRSGIPSIMPPLTWKATYPLIESRRSQLLVLEKRKESGA